MLRANIRQQPTAQQSQVMMSATRADIPNHPNNAKPIQSKETPKRNGNEDNQNGSRLIIHYIHEQRFHSFKRDMHLIYQNIFENRRVANVKMIVGNRNRRDSRHELIHKRPKRSLLTNTRKCGKFNLNQSPCPLQTYPLLISY